MLGGKKRENIIKDISNKQANKSVKPLSELIRKNSEPLSGWTLISDQQ